MRQFLDIHRVTSRNRQPQERPPTTSEPVTLPSNISQGRHRRRSQRTSSATWTDAGTSGDIGEALGCPAFVQQYNAIAARNGVRNFPVEKDMIWDEGSSPAPPKTGARLFFSKALRPGRSRRVSQASSLQQGHQSSSSRSAQSQDVEDMVQSMGECLFHLPPGFATGALTLPTCFRATAMYLLQHHNSRRLFCASRTAAIVNDVYNFYLEPDCVAAGAERIVRFSTIPDQIPCSDIDVADVFKKFLRVLPGGILGSLVTFDALEAIYSQLGGEPEFPRTKITKVRARLIALVVGGVHNRYRREFICAVIGLLSFIGREGEIAPREDADGRPLPTSDLMGYKALGIVFGPLLVGSLFDKYRLRPDSSTSKSVFVVHESPSLARNKSREQEDAKLEPPPGLDKISAANGVAHMLIANWRDVVRQLRSFGGHRDVQTSAADADEGDDRGPPDAQNPGGTSDGNTPGEPDQGGPIEEKEAGDDGGGPQVMQDPENKPLDRYGRNHLLSGLQGSSGGGGGRKLQKKWQRLGDADCPAELKSEATGSSGEGTVTIKGGLVVGVEMSGDEQLSSQPSASAISRDQGRTTKAHQLPEVLVKAAQHRDFWRQMDDYKNLVLEENTEETVEWQKEARKTKKALAEARYAKEKLAKLELYAKRVRSICDDVVKGVFDEETALAKPVGVTEDAINRCLVNLGIFQSTIPDTSRRSNKEAAEKTSLTRDVQKDATGSAQVDSQEAERVKRCVYPGLMRLWIAAGDFGAIGGSDETTSKGAITS